MSPLRVRLLAGWLFLCLPFCAYPTDPEERLLVFAAASLRNALDEIVDGYQARYPERVVVSYASSSLLARQIAEGAEADVYISANTQWMDYLDERGAIAKESRKNLLGNGLVLITHRDNPVAVEIAPGFDLRGRLGDGYLALGDPAHVPAGIYAEAALVSLGVWASVQDRIARADNVRAALALVAQREAPLGIVYRSDAVADAAVRVVAAFPADTHPPIIYPAARVSASPHPAADVFLDFLRRPEAAAVFGRFGFDMLK